MDGNVKLYVFERKVMPSCHGQFWIVLMEIDLAITGGSTKEDQCQVKLSICFS